jgi:aminoglycoside phosphotransferase (APT) family kinase protein
MSEHVDAARPVRAGEELDLEPLARYLREHIPELGDKTEVSVQQFPSGHSNLTYLVQAGSHEYVLRRPPFGSKVKSAHDMGREFRVLSKLHAVFGRAPEPILYCEDENVLGAKFYLMRRVKGIILRKELPKSVDLSGERLRRLHESLVDVLAELHAVDYARAGLQDLGKPEGYVERQVTGWTKRYTDSKTDEIPSVEQAAKWLAERMPERSDAALIHNDYKLDNVVLDAGDPTRIIGVLDWEMSTVGDPLMDLGTMLCYWVEADDSPMLQAVRAGPTHLPGSLTRHEVAERYAKKSGRDLRDALFYYVFGLFKTAVVIQQIYFRYKHGATKDERFAHVIHGVRIVCDQAVHAIEQGRL